MGGPSERRWITLSRKGVKSEYIVERRAKGVST